MFCLWNSESLGYGILNTAQGIWNPPNDWNPEFKFHCQGIRLGRHMNNFSRRFCILPLLNISERSPSESDDGSAESHDNDSTSPR